jgi:hypothetical protein
MKIKTALLFFVTHGFAIALGFATGIYLLPVLIAPPSPSAEQVQFMSAQATYTTEFRRDLADSDALHWGEGTVSVGGDAITLVGKLAPGPDYKLYLSPEFVETEADFNRLKPMMQRVGDVRTFNNFVVEIPAGIDPDRYNSVIVWCESFGQFITSAKYR